jgi:hypothetical protein
VPEKYPHTFRPAMIASLLSRNTLRRSRSVQLFFLDRATGNMARSTLLVSSSMPLSSRKRSSPSQWFRAQRIASAVGPRAGSFPICASNQTRRSATNGLLFAWRGPACQWRSCLEPAPRSHRVRRYASASRSRSAPSFWRDRRNPAARGSSKKPALWMGQRFGTRPASCRPHIRRTAGSRGSRRAARWREYSLNSARNYKPPSADRCRPWPIVTGNRPEVALFGAPTAWVEHRDDGFIGEYPCRNTAPSLA